MRIRRLNEGYSETEIRDMVDDCFINLVDIGGYMLLSFAYGNFLEVKFRNDNRFDPKSLSKIDDDIEFLTEFRDSSVRLSNLLGSKIHKIFIDNDWGHYVLNLNLSKSVDGDKITLGKIIASDYLSSPSRELLMENQVVVIYPGCDSQESINNTSCIIKDIKVNNNYVKFSSYGEVDYIDWSDFISEISKWSVRPGFRPGYYVDKSVDRSVNMNIPCICDINGKTLSIYDMDLLGNLKNRGDIKDYESIMDSVMEQYSGKPASDCYFKDFADIFVLIAK